MANTDLHEFSSDRPISNTSEDLLDRAKFATDLAEAIASWHGRDSLVVALHGDWGSGKSSIKQMVISKIVAIKNKNKPDIINFSPWEWAAQDKITAVFFQEISRSIKRIDKSKEGKKLAKTLNRYGRYLNAGEHLVAGLSSALPTFFVLATLAGASGILFDSDWVKLTSSSILAVLAAWAGALKWGKDILIRIGANAEATAKDNEQGLSEIRNELTNLLAKRESSLIVVMDDIDRLTSDQLRMVFQLIKANLEFPNVVFFLLFQRDLVEEKMTTGGQSGRNYLEKIIQVSFDIPKIEITKIQRLLFDKLDRFIKSDKSIAEMFNSNRWGNIFYGSLYIYFNNLRDVYRYTSTLSFHFSLLKGRSVFEVNPVDLIAIECLRVFEPDVYNEIARSKKILTQTSNFGGHKDPENIRLAIEKIINKSNSTTRMHVKELLKQLFPGIEWALGGMHYEGNFLSTWLREMRICHPSTFDKYFQFSVPSGDLSNSDIQEMLELTSDSEKFSHFLILLKEKNMLRNALSQFESYTQSIPIENANNYIISLLNIGDKLDNKSIGFTISSEYIHAVRLVFWFLKRIEKIEARGALLLDCFKVSDGVSIVEHIILGDDNRRKKLDPDIFLNDLYFEKIKTEFIYKINYYAENSPHTLITNSHLASILYRWKIWGDEQKLMTWVQSQTDSIAGCINLLKAFIIITTSQGIGDHVGRFNSVVKLDSIEEFISTDKIKTKISTIDINTLDEESKSAILAFNTALYNRENGIIDNW